jgi:hypothetical protein
MRGGVVLGAVAALAYVARRFVARRTGGADAPAFEPQPFPMPPRPVAVPTPPRPVAVPPPAADVPAAVPPDADGNCPVEQPIKGKLSTGIYHPPGAFAYERTRADRCYRDETAAQADGLRAAKR